MRSYYTSVVPVNSAVAEDVAFRAMLASSDRYLDMQMITRAVLDFVALRNLSVPELSGL